MNYQDYIDFSREELLGKVAAAMSEKRFRHVLGVEQTAIALAELYGCDVTKASLAALLHDYAKEVEDKVFLALIDQKNLDSDLKQWGNNIWHGVVGAYLIADTFGLADQEILQAIQRHTVGACQMTLLDNWVMASGLGIVVMGVLGEEARHDKDQRGVCPDDACRGVDVGIAVGVEHPLDEFTPEGGDQPKDHPDDGGYEHVAHDGCKGDSGHRSGQGDVVGDGDIGTQDQQDDADRAQGEGQYGCLGGKGGIDPFNLGHI